MKRSGRSAHRWVAGILITFLLCGEIWAESSVSTNQPRTYVISSVDFAIVGATLEYLLRQKLDITIGRGFATIQELEVYLAAKKQLLINERVLASAEVGYDLVEGADGTVEVDVHVNVQDSWNIVALPYARYDTNKGLLLSLRGRDYNFLGSLQTLAINLDYSYDNLGRHGLGGTANFAVPFQIGKVDLSAGASGDLRIFPDGTPTSSSSSLSVNASYYGLGFPLSAHITQSLTTNPDGVSNDVDPYYLTESFGTDASFALDENFVGLGPLAYNPSVSASWLWRLEEPVRQDRQGLVLGFGHSLSWGQANWVANTKRGLEISLSNTMSQYLRDGTFVVDLDGSLSWYLSYKGLFSFKTRTQVFSRPLGSPRLAIGGSLRGVVDARVNGDLGAFVNLDMPIKLFDFPSHILIGKDWLDFELQASPFVDAALIRPDAQSPIGSESFWLTGGLEMLAYPVRMRSFIVRASLGYDIRNVARTHSLTAPTSDGNSPYELYIGLGLFY